MSDHDLSLTIDEDHLPKSIREQTEARELDTFIHEPLNPQSPSSVGSRESWRQRAFGKINPGSMRGSIFTLAGTAIGAGALTTPLVLDYLGIIVGLIVIFFCAFITRYSLQTLVRASDQEQIYLYPDLVKQILGPNWGYTLEGIIILYVFGILISYQVIVGLLIPKIFGSLNIPGAGTLLDRDLTMVLACACLIGPISFFRDLSRLRFAGLVGIGALVYVTLVIFIEFPFFAKVNDFGDTRVADMNLNFFTSFSISLFAFVCHTNIVKVYGELAKRYPDHMYKIVDRSMIVELIFYSILAIFGYLSFLNDTPSLAPLRTPPSNISNDWAMVIGQVLIMLTLIAAVPINIPPCRDSILKICFKYEDPKSSPFWIHALITASLLVVTLIIALFYPNIISIFSFLGGFCGVFMVLIIPGAIYVKISGLPATHPKNIGAIVAVVILSAFGFISVILTLMALSGHPATR